jgi:hypothetical protein
MEQHAMQRADTQSEVTATEPMREEQLTFDVDLALPGVQELLRVLVEVALELQRKQLACRIPKAS